MSKNNGLSFETMVAIRDCNLKNNEKLVLYTIYSRGAQHTGSMTRLARDLGYTNDRQTRRIVQSLRDRDIINVIERDGTTHIITINTPVLQALTLDVEVTPVVEVTPDVEVKGGRRGSQGGWSSESRGGRRGSPTKENIKDNLKDNDEENLEDTPSISEELDSPSILEDEPDLPPISDSDPDPDSISVETGGADEDSKETKAPSTSKSGVGNDLMKQAMEEARQKKEEPTDDAGWEALAMAEGFHYSFRAYLAIPGMTAKRAYKHAKRKHLRS